MKVVAFNGSQRKNGNTAQALKKALEGAASVGAETELVNLYDEAIKGCVSCFACKIKNSKTNGLCAYRDALTPTLQKALDADVLIVGSPIYLSYPSAQTRAFIERLCYPLESYMLDTTSENYVDFKELQRRMEEGEDVEINLEMFKPITYTKKFTPTAMLYTMNCSKWLFDKIHYPLILSPNEEVLRMMFGHSESLYIHDTYQFNDYSKYDVTMFDEKAKRKQRDEQFPIDLQNAFDLGKRLTEMAYNNRKLDISF